MGVRGRVEGRVEGRVRGRVRARVRVREESGYVAGSFSGSRATSPRASRRASAACPAADAHSPMRPSSASRSRVPMPSLGEATVPLLRRAASGELLLPRLLPTGELSRSRSRSSVPSRETLIRKLRESSASPTWLGVKSGG